MIINEELYVLINGSAKRLDLNTPSGITLKFISNLFNDVSKITCSHSYTFKLPKTVNNSRVLDLAEDIRHDSAIIRKRLSAIFIQNGIPLFRDSNLYIESIDNEYQAIFTWNVIDGFQALKDYDLSINLLQESVICNYNNNGAHALDSDISSFDNSSSVLYPFYYAGVEPPRPFGTTKRPSSRSDREYTSSEEHYYCGLPVVPVYHILELINKYYGTKFKLGKRFSYSDWKDNSGNYDDNGVPDIINRGCIPLVNWKLTDAQQSKFRSRARYVNAVYESYNNIPNVLNFKYFYAPEQGGTFSEYKPTTNLGTYIIGATVRKTVDIEIDGAVILRYSAEVSNPVLRIYGVSRGSVIDLGSVDGICTIKGKTINEQVTYEYHFEFRKSLGYNSISIDADKTSDGLSIFFSAPGSGANIISCPFSEIYFIPNYTLIVRSLVRSVRLSAYSYMDVISNLPDISCMTFLKSLFYMAGGFPRVDNDGNIILSTYDILKKNINYGRVLDWSEKIKYSNSEYPSSCVFGVGGFCQKNYYLMKNDSLESSDDNELDVYGKSMGCITVQNETLELKKQIFQLPFYGRYTKNKKTFWNKTGNTVKLWEFDGSERTAVESKPAFGIICGKKWYDYFLDGTYDTDGVEVVSSKTETGNYVLSLDIWEGFSNITRNESYAYLQEIVKKPVVIKENFELNEFDLRDLDFTVPIYIEKYNSYFAIISIERDSKGICKAELIKLPKL